MNMPRGTGAALPVEFVRADVHAGVGIAVVAYLHHHHVLLPCVGLGHAQCQLIGFASRVDHIGNTKGPGQGGQKLFRKRYDIFMQVTGVGVQHRHLVLAGPDYARVLVAHMCHVVHRVQVFSSIGFVQVLHVTALHHQRLAIGEAEVFPKVPFAKSEKPWAFWGLLNNGQRTLYEQGRVRANAFPYFNQRRGGHSRVVTVFSQHVQHDLKMEMGRPPTIFVHRPDGANLLPAFNVVPRLPFAQRKAIKVPVKGIES